MSVADRSHAAEPSTRPTAPDAPGAPTAADLSAVVCAYTEARWPLLERAVESLLRQDAPVGEVVLVIDHNAALLERAQRRWPALAVIPSTAERGLSGARNSGVAASSGALVAFLDDDAEADPAWSAHLAAAYADPDVFGVGGLVEPDWESAPPRWWPAQFNWVVGCSWAGGPSVSERIRNPIGANMSVRRSALDAVGGFDTRAGRTGAVPTGCEETELFIRAHQRLPGRPAAVLAPRALVRHHVPASRTTFRYFTARCFGEGTSKRTVARIAGTGPALASERSYATRVLPRAALAALRAGAPARAAAIATGLLVTAAGYALPRPTRPSSRTGAA